MGILEKPMAIPSKNDMAKEGYGYHPCPMNPPPIPANIFLHHLLHQEGHRRLLWGSRMPKKLYSSIMQTSSADELVTGWGIHIIEGANKFAVLLSMLVILMASAIFSVTWAVLRDDIQGGFGIGAWLTSVQTIALMMILTKWNEI